jgi:uncharacterized protein
MNTLGVVLSEQCNLDCAYCGMDKTTTDKINPDDFLESLNNHVWPEGEGLRINFFGGEPLLQFDSIKKIVQGIDRENITFGMPTNGTILNEEMVEFLNKNKIRVSVSFDGLWQGKNRAQLTGKDSTMAFMRNIELLKRLDNIKSHTMITKGNYNLLENHLHILNKLGTNTELTLVRDRGIWSAEDVDALKIGMEELFRWYEDDTTRELPNFIMFYLRHFLLYESKGIVVDGCGAGKETNFFSGDSIVPCVRFNGDNDAREKMDEYRRMPECETCSVNNYCKKGCLYEQIKNEAPIGELCDIYRFIYNRISVMVQTLKNDGQFKNMVVTEIKSENMI